MLLPRNAKSFKISHMEMIKGMRLGGVGKALAYYDTLEIPIIENTADEEDLTEGMEKVGVIVSLLEGPRTLTVPERVHPLVGHAGIPGLGGRPRTKPRILQLGQVMGTGQDTSRVCRLLV